MNVNCFKRGENGQMGCRFNNVSCQIFIIGPLTDVDAKCLVISSDAVASPHCGEQLPQDSLCYIPASLSLHFEPSSSSLIDLTR